MTGYLAYDWTHYYTHHFRPRRGLGKWLRTYHLRHHYHDPNAYFGISSPLWDLLFGTFHGTTENARRSRGTAPGSGVRTSRHSLQGFTSRIPNPSKCWTLRVANVACLDATIPAISASYLDINRLCTRQDCLDAVCFSIRNCA